MLKKRNNVDKYSAEWYFEDKEINIYIILIIRLRSFYEGTVNFLSMDILWGKFDVL